MTINTFEKATIYGHYTAIIYGHCSLYGHNIWPLYGHYTVTAFTYGHNTNRLVTVAVKWPYRGRIVVIYCGRIVAI